MGQVMIRLSPFLYSNLCIKIKNQQIIKKCMIQCSSLQNVSENCEKSLKNRKKSDKILVKIKTKD